MNPADEPAVPGRSTRATAANMARAAARQAKADDVTHADVIEAAKLLRNAADLLAPLPPPGPVMRGGRTLPDAREAFLRDVAGYTAPTALADADVVGGSDDR